MKKIITAGIVSASVLSIACIASLHTEPSGEETVLGVELKTRRNVKSSRSSAEIMSDLYKSRSRDMRVAIEAHVEYFVQSPDRYHREVSRIVNQLLAEGMTGEAFHFLSHFPKHHEAIKSIESTVIDAWMAADPAAVSVAFQTGYFADSPLNEHHIGYIIAEAKGGALYQEILDSVLYADASPYFKKHAFEALIQQGDTEDKRYLVNQLISSASDSTHQGEYIAKVVGALTVDDPEDAEKILYALPQGEGRQKALNAYLSAVSEVGTIHHGINILNSSTFYEDFYLGAKLLDTFENFFDQALGALLSREVERDPSYVLECLTCFHDANMASDFELAALQNL